MKDWWKSLSISLAFALYPVLFLYGHNLEQTYFHDVTRALAAATVAGVVLPLLLAAALRDLSKGGLLAAAFFILFFSYGHIVNLFPKASASVAAGVLGVEAVAWIGAAVGLFRMRKEPGPFATIVLVIGLFLLVFPAISITVAALRPQPAREPEHTSSPGPATNAVPVTGYSPDIYYIILDSYTSERSLNEFYGYDNSGFLNELRARGFFIAENSHSNYGSTLLSLTSSLNMTYLDEMTAPYQETSDRRILMDSVRDSAAVRTLKSRGYQFVNVASGFSGTDPQPNADIEFRMAKGNLNEFELLLAGTTPLAQIPYFQETADPFLLRRYAVLHAFERLTNLPDSPGPRFVLAHILSPHPPFVFDGDGNMRERKGRFNQTKYTKAEYIEGYRGQVDFVNARLLPAVDAILGRYPKDRQPVIIIQGDHGPKSLKRKNNSTEAFYRERFSILNAYLIPPGTQCRFPDTITPVNSFRVLFSCLFGEQLEPLPDASYYSSSKKPFSFKSVDDLVKANLKPEKEAEADDAE